MKRFWLALFACLWASGAFAQDYIVGARNLLTSQVSIGTSATQAAVNRARMSVSVVSTTTTTVYCGSSSSVTTSSGIPVAGIVGYAVTMPFTGPVWCISGGSAVTVGVMDIF